MRGESLRRAALALPEAVEQETWGEPTFRVRGKIFAMLSPDGRAASVKATVEHQEALVGTNPRTYSVAPYVGRYGWVRVELRSADPDEVRDLVTEAWRLTAPKRLVAGFAARS